MPRKKKRRGAVSSSGPTTLLILAGLPNPLQNRIVSLIPQLFGQHVRGLALGSSNQDGTLYPASLVRQMVRGAGAFAVKRRAARNEGENRAIVPAEILLCYVPALDQEVLLSAFDFFVFPIPLEHLQRFDHTGRQLRHNEDAIVEALRRVAGETLAEEKPASVVKQRLSSPSPKEPLFLPPQNFFLTDQDRLAGIFRELRSGARAWDGIRELRRRMFDRETLPWLAHNERKELFVDCREVIFLPAHRREYHGLPRELGEEPTDDAIKCLMQTLYRFGFPLPRGFHHDLQREGGAAFDGMIFNCCEKGRFRVRGSHVNVYPNDFVRADPM